jgi:hypothetical protein
MTRAEEPGRTHANRTKLIATRTVAGTRFPRNSEIHVAAISHHGASTHCAFTAQPTSAREHSERAPTREGAWCDTYQPPPPVRKRRMKRSCSERVWLVLCPSIESSDASLIELTPCESYRSPLRDVNENRRPRGRFWGGMRNWIARSRFERRFRRFSLTARHGGS